MRIRYSRAVARMGERRMHAKFWWGNLKEKHRLEEIGVGGVHDIEIGLKEIRLDDVDWINLAQDRDEQRDIVSTVINFRGPENKGDCPTS
jgi:hypothetical protein